MIYPHPSPLRRKGSKDWIILYFRLVLISIITRTDLATRLLEVQKQKGLSQQQVAEIAGVHFTNVGKYQRPGAVPGADVFNRTSKALEISPDYLLNITIQDKAKNNIQDSELLLQFEKAENYPKIKSLSLKSS